MAEEYNSVPLGQAGTGAAFVLGQSQAAQNVAKNVLYNRKIEQQNALLKQKQAQQIANDWKTNSLKVDGSLYWQPEFNKRYQQHLDEGIKLRQMGINPWNYNANDPNQVEASSKYLLDRQRILADTDTRKAKETVINNQFKEYAKNPNDYEPESFQDLNQYISKPYSEVSDAPIPQLRKAFDPSKEIIPRLDPITFQTSKIIGNNKVEENKVLEDPTKNNIENLFKESNGGNRYLKRMTGLTVSEAKYIPNTFDENKVDLFKQYKGNPILREDIAREYGITGEGEALNELINTQATQRLQSKQAYNSVIDQYYGLAKAKANEFLKQNPDYASRRMQLSEEAAARSRTRFNERNSGSDGVGTAQSITIPYNNGKSNVQLNEYVPISLSKKNFAGSPYIDLKTGKEGGKLPSSSDYEVVGVGNAPFIKSGDLQGAISQPDYEKRRPDNIQKKPIIHVQIPAKGYEKAKDYFIPYDRLPENVKNSKSVREALSKFAPATQTTQSTSFSKAQENGIDAVMKSSGASREAVIQALRKAGKIK